MTLSLIDLDRFQLMEEVIEAYHRNPNETQIARELGIQRKEVVALIADYRAALANDNQARDAARDHLNMMSKHYDVLIKKFYDLIEEIDTLSFNHQVAGQKKDALKAIAELEAKRVDTYQKAGMLESADLGDELAEREEREALILDILQNELCPECKNRVSLKLARLTGTLSELEVIEAEVVH